MIKKIILLIFFSYLVYFCLIPPFQTPDEFGHFETVYWSSKFIYPTADAQKINPNPYTFEYSQLFNLGNENQNITLNFEKIRDSNLNKNNAYPDNITVKFIPESSQAYNPPLYYFFAGLFLKISQYTKVNLLSQFYITRLASGLFYFSFLWIFYLMANLIYHNKKTSLNLLLLFGLNPLLIQSGIGVSPDIGAAFFSLLFFYIFVKKITTNKIVRLKDGVTMGIIAGLASLCKTTGILLAPAFLTILILYFNKSKQIIKPALSFIFVFLLIQAPWYIYNLLRYGKLLLTDVAYGVNIIPSQKSLTNIVITSIYNFRHTFAHFSGFMGLNDALPFKPVFIVYMLIVIISFITGTIFLIKNNKSYIYKYMLISVFWIIIFFLALSIQRAYSSHAKWIIGGRNALVIYPQVFLISIIGLNKMTKVNIDKLSNLLARFAVFYNVFIAVTVLIPRYYV